MNNKAILSIRMSVIGDSEEKNEVLNNGGEQIDIRHVL
ncbi:hypothetical protein PMAL9190_01218 [Photobacterium malacitanum]|uniref:Uncharacterized protein n=1 Tax=Photobacterium malacitanum TaxID=2204294 RepID=A0A1Y6MCW8_9GAMM|nr:hypothetical protein PMAL9190_01218 [Photobacterium malacitanum]